MDIAYHHLETLRKENTQMKTYETAERRTRRLLERQWTAQDKQTWKQHAVAFAKRQLGLCGYICIAVAFSNIHYPLPAPSSGHPVNGQVV